MVKATIFASKINFRKIAFLAEKWLGVTSRSFVRSRVYLGALQCGLCSNNRGIFIAVNEFRKYNHHKIGRHIKGREHRKNVQSRLPLKFDFFSSE